MSPTDSHDHDHDHSHDHDDSHDHDHDPRASRAEALEAILIERGLLDPAAVDLVLDRFETQLSPMLGAKVVARAWTDPAFKARLLRTVSRRSASWDSAARRSTTLSS